MLSKQTGLFYYSYMCTCYLCGENREYLQIFTYGSILIDSFPQIWFRLSSAENEIMLFVSATTLTALIKCLPQGTICHPSLAWFTVWCHPVSPGCHGSQQEYGKLFHSLPGASLSVAGWLTVIQPLRN